jgi:hypothetical protein
MRVVAMFALPSHSWTLVSDVSLVVERISGGRRAQRMGADVELSSAEYAFTALEGLAALVFERSEQRAVLVLGVAGGVEVIVDQRVGPVVRAGSGRNRVFSLLSSTLRCGTPRRA